MDEEKTVIENEIPAGETAAEERGPTDAGENGGASPDGGEKAPAPEKKPERKDTAGGEFVKKIRPVGCVMFLFILVMFLVICFSAGKDPIPGYEPPNTSEYYAQNLDELVSELEENVFPHIEGVVSAEVEGDVIVITIEESHFAVSRSAVLNYYDAELFQFVWG